MGLEWGGCACHLAAVGGDDVIEVSCANRDLRVAITEDGQSLPVTHLFDADGEECDDIEQAVTCVAGPDRDGFWLTIDFREMEKVPLQ